MRSFLKGKIIIIAALVVLVGAGVYLLTQKNKKENIPEGSIDRLPIIVGQCSKTTVSKIGTRLVDSATNQNMVGSGSAIEYTNGGHQVSYDTITGIEDSIAGDEVNLCLLSIPTGCPVGDDRGKIYSATNLRTGEYWEAQDSEHSCGGA